PRPATSSTSPRGRPRASASSRSTASFAFPSSGGAWTLTFQASPWRPTIRPDRLPGATRSWTRIAPPMWRRLPGSRLLLSVGRRGRRDAARELAGVVPARPRLAPPRGGERVVDALLGLRQGRGLLDHAEGGAQERLDAAGVGGEASLLALCAADDRAGFLMGLGDDQLRLAIRLRTRL